MPRKLLSDCYRGWYGWEGHTNSVLRMRNQTMWDCRYKLDKEKMRHQAAMAELKAVERMEVKQSRRVRRRVEDDYSRIRAEQTVLQAHAFKKYDPSRALTPPPGRSTDRQPNRPRQRPRTECPAAGHSNGPDVKATKRKSVPNVEVAGCSAAGKAVARLETEGSPRPGSLNVLQTTAGETRALAREPRPFTYTASSSQSPGKGKMATTTTTTTTAAATKARRQNPRKLSQSTFFLTDCDIITSTVVEEDDGPRDAGDDDVFYGSADKDVTVRAGESQPGPEPDPPVERAGREPEASSFQRIEYMLGKQSPDAGHSPNPPAPTPAVKGSVAERGDSGSTGTQTTASHSRSSPRPRPVSESKTVPVVDLRKSSVDEKRDNSPRLSLPQKDTSPSTCNPAQKQPSPGASPRARRISESNPAPVVEDETLCLLHQGRELPRDQFTSPGQKVERLPHIRNSQDFNDTDRNSLKIHPDISDQSSRRVQRRASLSETRDASTKKAGHPPPSPSLPADQSSSANNASNDKTANQSKPESQSVPTNQWQSPSECEASKTSESNQSNPETHQGADGHKPPPVKLSALSRFREAAEVIVEEVRMERETNMSMFSALLLDRPRREMRLRPVEKPACVEQQEQKDLWNSLLMNVQGAVRWKAKVLRESQGIPTSRQLRRQAQDQQHARDRERRHVFPGHCKTTYAMKKFLSKEVNDLVDAYRPENVRKSHNKRLVEKASLPDFVDRVRSTTAILREFRRYQRDHGHKVET